MSNKAEWKKNIASSSIWIRGFFMILYFIVSQIVRFLILVISVFQFIYSVIVGQPNDKLLNFSKGLGGYIYQIALFLTFNTNTKPYPFSEWGDVGDANKLLQGPKD